MLRLARNVKFSILKPTIIPVAPWSKSPRRSSSSDQPKLKTPNFYEVFGLNPETTGCEEIPRVYSRAMDEIICALEYCEPDSDDIERLWGRKSAIEKAYQ